jgi:arylsulfatase A-like enzyme
MLSTKPNILLLVIDGFRADRCFGEKKTSITPNLDKLIKNGIYFDKTIPSASMTFPSITSLMTSKYPFECLVEDKNLIVPRPDITNYFEKFSKKGYHIYSNNPKKIKYLGLENICSCVSKEYEDSKALNQKLGQTILEQLKSKAIQEPWLFYLHIYDLHDAEFFKITKTNNFLSDKKFGDNKYERMVSTIDVWLGKIFDELDLKNTIIVLTADHGTVRGTLNKQTEDFYEKLVNQESKNQLHKKILEKIPKKLLSRYASFMVKKLLNFKNLDLHDIQSTKSTIHEQRVLNYLVNPIENLYDDKLVVPLIFSGFNLPKNKIIHDQVQSIDIFPTLAEILNFSDMNHDIRGRSLFSQIKGHNFKEIPAFIECVTNSTKMPKENVIGIRTSEFKYFRNRNDAEKDVHLFDLKKDPLEENNIQESNPDIIIKMEEILLSLQSGKGFSFDKEENLTDEQSKTVENELRKLGYI